MPKTLRALIQASGHAGVPGQSFRNHVVGAASGASLTGYNLYDWLEWAAAGYVQDADYPNGAYLDLTFDMQAGEWFHHLRNLHVPTPASLHIAVSGGINAGLEEIPTNAQVIGVVDPALSKWDAHPNEIRYLGNKLRVQLLGPWEFYGHIITGIDKNWFHEYQQYEIPMDGHTYSQLPFDWVIVPALQQQQTGGDAYGTVRFVVHFPQDPGGFNPPLVSPPFQVRVGKRWVAPSLEFEWATDPNFTSVISTAGSLQFVTQSDDLGGPNFGWVYLRYRQAGTVDWTTYPANNSGIYWEDPRYHAFPPYNTP